MAEYLLGIDNGSTVSKAALFTTDGREVAVASRTVPLMEAQPGYSERDMETMWLDTVEAIREVLDKVQVDPHSIRGLACTGHGNGLYLVDRTGHPLRPAVNSMDQRAQSCVDQWKADGVDARVLPRTAQCLWPGQPGALLTWLRVHEPECLSRTGWVLFAKDYIRFRLTGEIQAELTDMSGSGLMNVLTRDYDDEVLTALGLAEFRDWLPPLVESHDCVGVLTAEASEATGLKAGMTVAGGMFDIDACGLASGIIDERPMSLVAGTWGNNQYIAREPLVDPDLFMSSVYSMPGWYLMLEGSPTSAGNLEWYLRECFKDDRDPAPTNKASLYAYCDQLVAGQAVIDNTLLFLPFLYGCNEGQGVQGAILGMAGHHQRAHLLRAVFEGIVFSHQSHLRRLLQFRPAPETIRFTGGAARSEVWVQMFADCFQLPIEIPAGTELGALGAAMAAGIAAGCFQDFPEAVEAMTRLARRQDPDPGRADYYQTRYAHYQAAIQALSNIHPTLPNS